MSEQRYACDLEGRIEDMGQEIWTLEKRIDELERGFLISERRPDEGKYVLAWKAAAGFDVVAAAFINKHPTIYERWWPLPNVML